MNNILDELKWRGIINNVTNEEKLLKAISNNKGIYVGFDPSASSLHLGNYVMIILLRRFKNQGIRTFALLGGATGMIGDPSGKSIERNLLNNEQLNINKLSIKNQLEKYAKVEILDNFDHFKDLTFLTFLRDAGKLININYMLEKESIKSRLENGISFTEFAYTLMQGYDFLYYYEKLDIAIQSGGSDQWGNITTGCEMIRKVHGDNNLASGLTINLLVKKDGTKFGKSEKGAIFLAENLTSFYEMYQFLINQNDDDVIKLLKFLTFLSENEIKQIETDLKENPQLKNAQKELAKLIVIDIHGIEKYEEACNISNWLFNNEIQKLTKNHLTLIFKSLNGQTCDNSSISVLDLLKQLEIADSNRMVRDLLKNNSISINGNKNLTEDLLFTKTESLFNSFLLVKKGKRKYYLLQWI